MKSDLKVAFLTANDPGNRNSWSGIHFQMMRSLQRQFENVIPLGPAKLNILLYFVVKFCNLSNKLFPHYRYDISRSRLLANYYASFFKNKLKGKEYDLIFAPASSVEIAYLNTSLPVCYYSDTSVSQIKDYYNTFSNLIGFSEKETELIQDKALKRSNIVIHSSKWATDHVIKHYKVQERQAFTVSMGANIDDAPSVESIRVKLKEKQTCKLLLLGMDWERKGGAIAYETLLKLIEMGVDAELTICGCVPPDQFRHERMKIIPFLNKNREEEYNQFLQLMGSTHFLLLPTRAECSAIVFAEASAYGIPSITTDTGGVGSMVENNVNGFMLPMEAKGAEYAGVIKDIFQDNDRYEALVYTSRAKFDEELNWDVWGQKVRNIITNNL